MKTVLIIEDNPTMVRALEDNFTMKGYQRKNRPSMAKQD